MISATARLATPSSSSSLGAPALAALTEVLPGVLDVAAHLGDEFVHGVEPELVPEAVHQLDAQLLAVDVLMEVQDVGLHRGADLGVKGGADADAGAGEVGALPPGGGGPPRTQGRGRP